MAAVGVMDVHIDGSLRAVLSQAVLVGAATLVGKSVHAVYLLRASFASYIGMLFPPFLRLSDSKR